MRSTRNALAILCAAALAACGGAESITGPGASTDLIPTISTDFLPGIPVLDPFAPEHADDAGVAESARGGAHLYIGTELRTFAFTSKNRADGTTQGQYQINNRSTGAREHGMVTCLEVAGNQAWIGAIITHSTVPERIGLERVWIVVDRGEGSGAPPDRLSLTELVPAQTCHLRPSFVLEDIDSGNIQVRDGS